MCRTVIKVPAVTMCFFHCRDELGKNINADEAAAMGAVYQAAALSKAFKVKPFLVRDAAVFPIQVRACHPLQTSLNHLRLQCWFQHHQEKLAGIKCACC